MGKFLDSFRKSFRAEPHIRTALANMFANFDHDLADEIRDSEWDKLTKDFIFYFNASVKESEK